jgi:SsrA-binding protein
MSEKSDKAAIRDIVVNRRAWHEFSILDQYEAGISLTGSEVKSLRGGRANLQEAWVRLENHSAFLQGCHISPYEQANRNNHEPLRERRLLLHASELSKLHKATTEKGLTIIPLRIYLKGSRVKVEIAVAKGKKLYDKRQTLKERDAKREMDRAR